MVQKNGLPKATPEETMGFAKLLKLFLQCDESRKVVGKCPKCGGKVSGVRLTEGKFEGHGDMSCENCGLLFTR